MATYEHPCDGAFAINLGPLRIEKVGCVAIICIRLAHVLVVGSKIRFGWGRAH